METKQIYEAAMARGAHAAAVEDIVARVNVFFAGKTPALRASTGFLPACPCGPCVRSLTRTLRRCTLSSRCGWNASTSLNPVPVHSRRPMQRELLTEELESLEDLPWAERVTRGRQMQQSPLPVP